MRAATEFSCLLAWQCGLAVLSSFARPDSRGRLSPHDLAVQTSNCCLSCSLLGSLLLFRLSLRRRGSHDFDGGLRADGKATLRDEIHGALNRDADSARFLVDPAVGGQRLFFGEADAVELAALIFFEFGIRERFLRIISWNVARVRRSVRDQRVDRRLLGLGTLIQKVIQPVDDEVHEHSGHNQAQQEVEDAGGADVLALIASVAGWVRRIVVDAHNYLLAVTLSIMRSPDDDAVGAEPLPRMDRRGAAKAARPDSGRSKPATGRQWRWVQPHLPQ